MVVCPPLINPGLEFSFFLVGGRGLGLAVVHDWRHFSLDLSVELC